MQEAEGYVDTISANECPLLDSSYRSGGGEGRKSAYELNVV